MTDHKRTELKRVAAGLAVLLLAAAVLTGAAAADSNAGGDNWISIDHHIPDGWIKADPNPAADTKPITVTVNPPMGYSLIEETLSVIGQISGNTIHPTTASGQYTFTMPDEPVTIYAKFTLNGGVFYYENVGAFGGVYKYLDNVIDLAYSNPGVLEPLSSRPEGQYASTTTTDGFILKKLDADVFMYVYDDKGNKISSVIDSTVPRGSKVSFKITPNIPTAYSTTGGTGLVGLKFISPSGTVASTYLGKINYANGQQIWKNGLETDPTSLDSNLEEGEWTVFAYFIPNPLNNEVSGFLAPYTPEAYRNGTPSHFTISSSSASITADPTTVQSWKEFTITISGKPKEQFYLKPNDNKYTIKEGQENFDYANNLVTIGQNGTTMLALTAGSPGIFTLQICNNNDHSIIEDDCEIEITRASLTANAERESYYMGSDVKLFGTNDSLIYPLYYYIEGTNIGFQWIPDSELKLIKTGKEWETTIKGSYFSGMNLDTGAYTIYVSDYQNTDKSTALGPDAVSASVSVKLLQPALLITSASEVVIQDESLTVRGVAENTSQVMYYIFGNNKCYWDLADVGRNGNFVIDERLSKEDYAPGQYYVVIQHPMYDRHFNVAAGYDYYEPVVALNTTGDAVIDDGTWRIDPDSQILFSLNSRQSANAAYALCDAIDTENIDDVYTKFSFELKADAVTVDPVPSQITKGMPFAVSGTSARADGTAITVELLSTAFGPESKYSATSASFVTMITYPNADGKWIVTFDTSGLNADDYTISVSANGKTVSNKQIRIVNGAATPVETQKGTPSVPTYVPTATPTPHTSTPGFGFAVIPAILGAAALLLKGRRE